MLKITHDDNSMMNRIYISLCMCLLLAMTEIQNISAAEYKDFFHTRTGTNVVVSMTQDANGVLWLGTTKGIMRFEDLNNPVLCHSLYPSEIQKAILSVSSTNDGRLWITMLSNKKYIYTPSLRKLEEIDNDWIQEMGIDAEGWWTMHIAVTDSESVWFITDRKVYHQISFATGKPVLIATLKEPVVKVCADRYNCHIVTDKHIYSFANGNKISRDTISYNSTDTPMFRLIHKDCAGNLWGGNNDLYRFDQKQNMGKNKGSSFCKFYCIIRE